MEEEKLNDEVLKGMTLEEFAAIDNNIPTCAEKKEESLDVQPQPGSSLQLEADSQNNETEEINKPVITFETAQE